MSTYDEQKALRDRWEAAKNPDGIAIPHPGRHDNAWVEALERAARAIEKPTLDELDETLELDGWRDDPHYDLGGSPQ